MKAKDMTTALLVIGSMWAMTACSGSPLAPEAQDGLSDNAAARQTFPEGAATPDPRMPELPVNEQDYRPKRKVQ